MAPAPSVKHFASAAAFRRWLEGHHARATELWVGFYRKDTGRGGITYPEALDEALCFGWIDGVRKKVSADAYTNRFTPRKPGSAWSSVNVRHAERLTAAGRMRPAGTAAFAARERSRTGVHSSGQRPRRLPRALEQVFRADREAWAFWSAQPPGYRRVVSSWVASAKQEETRRRRLERVIAESAAGRRLPEASGKPREKR